MTTPAGRSLVFVVLAGATALGLLAACSNDPTTAEIDAASTCPTFSSTCPATQPSFKGDVQPVIATYCLACHGDGGIEQPLFDYSTYQGVYEHHAEILNAVAHCVMPPPDASPPAPMPSEADRQTIVTWIACGAPNN